MNDPFECLASIERDFSDDTLTEFKEFSTRAKNRLLQGLSVRDNSEITSFLNKLRRESINRYAFSALSEDTFDILMWSHYADSHRGITIGFEFDDFENRKVFQKVSYVNRLIDYDLMAWAKFMDGDNDLMVNFLSDLTVKSKDWEREKEWRIWQIKPGYYRYKSSELREINFGINCPDETKAIISKIVELHDDVKLYEMELSKDPFKLTR